MLSAIPIRATSGRWHQAGELRQAIAHLAKLIPKAERDLPQVLTAFNIMTKAAEQGGARPMTYRAVVIQAVEEDRHLRARE
jgi:hypothetical protein